MQELVNNVCGQFRCFLKNYAKYSAFSFESCVLLQIYVFLEAVMPLFQVSFIFSKHWPSGPMLSQSRDVSISVPWGWRRQWRWGGIKKMLKTSLRWCYYSHRSRDALSPVCGIFCDILVICNICGQFIGPFTRLCWVKFILAQIEFVYSNCLFPCPDFSINCGNPNVSVKKTLTLIENIKVFETYQKY